MDNTEDTVDRMIGLANQMRAALITIDQIIYDAGDYMYLTDFVDVLNEKREKVVSHEAIDFLIRQLKRYIRAGKKADRDFLGRHAQKPKDKDLSQAGSKIQ